jgi:VanZ family protein
MKRNKLIYFTILWAFLTILLALGPRFSLGNGLNNYGLNHGPIAHFFAYSILAGLFFFLLDNSKTRMLYSALKSWFLAGFFGLIVEIGQYFVPERTFDAGDVFFNLISAACGSLFALWYFKRKILISRS